MSNLRDNIQVVLVRPRFPENIGMCARACANMGISRLALVQPELWQDAQGNPEPRYQEKALSLATSAGREVVGQMKIFSSLEDALSESTLSIGATARTGGWRQGVLTPAQAMEHLCAHISDGGRVSLVFGPEDKGLDNTSIELCSHLVNIPTAGEPSLNLAQAVLALLYELSRVLPFERREQPPRPGRARRSPLISLAQQELLIDRLKAAMLALDTLPAENSNYFMLPIRRLVSRSQIRHNEFSILMGICNKIIGMARSAGRGSGEPPSGLS
ncbi:MAG: RNA methyltransferase [Desulfovibrionaceae bacterium]|nr:RNA methyltransferase [Desulfovibrionaceae bacterium]